MVRKVLKRAGFSFVLGMAAVMAVCHLTIFFILCAYYKAQVREINQMLEEQKQRIHQQQTGGAL